MTQKKTMSDPRNVRRETLLLFTCGALFVGFIAGVMLGIYSSGTGLPGRHSHGSESVAVAPASNERSAAIGALEKKTNESPSDTRAWVELGNAYFDTGRFESAIQAYTKALELDPGNANVWTDLGIMYRRSGRPQEAIRAFDKAAEMDPKHEIALMNKGIVLLHDMSDPAGAIRAWEALLAINPLAMAPSGVSVDQMVQQLKKQQSSQTNPVEN
jgi:cytochrome c-type biogenesis protein CcmH/NrfG